MKISWLIISISLLTGCSLYESQGRKFLESQAIEFASSAAYANLLNCDTAPSTTAWILFEKNDRAELFTTDNESFELRVTPVLRKQFSCYFRFGSAQEMYEKSSAATELTLHQSLAE